MCTIVEDTLWASRCIRQVDWDRRMQQQLRQEKKEKSLSGGDEGGIQRLTASSKRLQVLIYNTLTSTTVKKILGEFIRYLFQKEERGI